MVQPVQEILRSLKLSRGTAFSVKVIEETRNEKKKPICISKREYVDKFEQFSKVVNIDPASFCFRVKSMNIFISFMYHKHGK